MKLNLNKEANWKTNNEFVFTHINNNKIQISLKDNLIIINGVFKIKGCTSLQEAKEKAINFLSK